MNGCDGYDIKIFNKSRLTVAEAPWLATSAEYKRKSNKLDRSTAGCVALAICDGCARCLVTFPDQVRIDEPACPTDEQGRCPGQKLAQRNQELEAPYLKVVGAVKN